MDNYFVFDYCWGFENLEWEVSLCIINGEICGKILEVVCGIFLCIGFGCNELVGWIFGYWFDGDGMVYVFIFGEEGVCYCNCFVCIFKY